MFFYLPTQQQSILPTNPHPTHQPTPEKRQKFDQGEDPLDPETQQGQQWHEGFKPFGHGGFQFKFHFG